MKVTSQPTRLFILLVYICILFVASKIALGSWMPPGSEKGLWFYSGLGSLLLGSLIVTPYYTKPADAISYAVAGLIGLLAVNLWPARGDPFDRALWVAVSFYVGSVLVAGIFSITTKDSDRPALQKLSQSLFAFCDTFGGPRSIFSAIFLFALIAFNRANPREFITIGAAGIITVALRPLESLANLGKKLGAIWQRSRIPEAIGEVVAQQSPGIVLVRCTSDAELSFGDLLVVPTSDGAHSVGVAADYVGWAEGRWLRVLTLDLTGAIRKELNALLPSMTLRQAAFRMPYSTEIPEQLSAALARDQVSERKKDLIGVVAPETDVSRLRFEILRTDLDLEEGRLVEVRLGARMVLYQVVNGLTKEEILEQKNSFGFVRGEAKKIGYWNTAKSGFEVVKWIPLPNAPVFLTTKSQFTPNREAIGHLPGTSYPITLNVDLMVTHNAAILGILGSGKSFLALELIERMVAEKIKVVCLDLTNQYAEELAHCYDLDSETKRLETLKSVGPPGKANCQQNVEEGGSIKEFSSTLRKDLQNFLAEEEGFVKMYNPAGFEVWRQDSKPFSGKASMASLTPTEITRLVAETLLELLQDKMSDKARACIVFEEAHSLIPEWNAVASEGDKTATNGTAKAILQGRKYGLGCLVITQRTANVTKSVLNQCNTIFGLRVFDATGMDFLKNYVGEDYATVLSTLEDRHAVVFGRASSCRNPVLVRLNDRQDFVNVFRPMEAAEAGNNDT